MPPRSFLVSSPISSEEKIVRMADAATVAALSGHGRNVRYVRELFHMIEKAGHALGELWHDVTHLDDEDDEK
jgi:hypothetical protein